jgi:hypothetical protein
MPLLLIDVDGVLMPLGRSVPSGFERHTTPTSDIVASSRHGEWLHALSGSYEIVWATAWGDAANDTFGRLFGLPRFDHVDLHDLPRAGTRKLAAVAAYAKRRPLAWIDDELYEDASDWANTRLEPTLLVRPAPYVGLAQAHFDSLRRFASESAPTTSP